MTEDKGQNTKKLEEHLLEYVDFLTQQGKGKANVHYYICPARQLVKFAKEKLAFYPHQLTKAESISDFDTKQPWKLLENRPFFRPFLRSSFSHFP